MINQLYGSDEAAPILDKVIIAAKCSSPETALWEITPVMSASCQFDGQRPSRGSAIRRFQKPARSLELEGDALLSAAGEKVEMASLRGG